MTEEVDTVNVAWLAPDGTVTEEGGTAWESLEVNLMTNPPFAAGLDRVIVPVEPCVPSTTDGLKDRPTMIGGAIVRTAD